MKRIAVILVLLCNTMLIHADNNAPIMPASNFYKQRNALEKIINDVWGATINQLIPKFPYLEEELEDYYAEKEEEIEKPEPQKKPRTNADALFIFTTIKKELDRQTFNAIKFTGKEEEQQHAKKALRAMLIRMLNTTLQEITFEGGELYACPCIPANKRIAFAVLLVNNVHNQYRNPDQQLVYTSFAAGHLAQDYLILTELYESYNNLLIHLIDLEYPEVYPFKEPAPIKKKKYSARIIHQAHLLNEQEARKVIEYFKTKMNALISRKEKASKKKYNFDLRLYQNPYQFIEQLKRNQQEKSNIMIMVDPNTGYYFYSPSYPGLTNVVNIWLEPAQEIALVKETETLYKPLFIIYVPHHHGIQMYQYESPHGEFSAENVAQLASALKSLVLQFKANTTYSPKFVTRLFQDPLITGPITEGKIIKQGFPILMAERKRVRFGQEEKSFINILYDMIPVNLGKVPVLIGLGIDPHISFQDLVWDTLKPNALVYTLYHHDPLQDKDTSVIGKVNITQYKKANVITPNSGAIDLKEGYKKVIF